MLYSLYIGLLVAALLLQVTRQISQKQASLFFGTVMTLAATYHFGQGDLTVAGIDGGIAAIHWWFWNKNGGDDDRKRLKEALKKFVPVRRTAPTGA